MRCEGITTEKKLAPHPQMIDCCGIVMTDGRFE